jgi:hypothetical protein
LGRRTCHPNPEKLSSRDAYGITVADCRSHLSTPHDKSDASLGATSNDVNMLVCTGGRQRTEQEFRTLLDASSLRLTAIIPISARICVADASPI